MTGIGRQGEDLAARHYQAQGYRIIDQNYIFPKGKQIGELDLVAVRGRAVVFVEVKTRRSGAFGSGAESVDLAKQQRLAKMAELYMQNHPELSGFDYRVDLAEVDIDNSENPVIILENVIEDLD